VVSVSYHNPLWVAERIVLLDHLTRGRAMLGLGPGSLPTDGIMIGLQQSRRAACWKMGSPSSPSSSDEPVTFRNERRDLREARLHLRPYSNPLFDIAVAAVASPTGARLAGQYGVGMLSVGATTAACRAQALRDELAGGPVASGRRRQDALSGCADQAR
jgi:limonene 1,2-monooxygenase